MANTSAVWQQAAHTTDQPTYLLLAAQQEPYKNMFYVTTQEFLVLKQIWCHVDRKRYFSTILQITFITQTKVSQWVDTAVKQNANNKQLAQLSANACNSNSN